MAKKKKMVPYNNGYIEESSLKKAQIIADIVKEHYEPGRQDRCMEWVYRNIVYKRYPMSLRRFQWYIQIARDLLGYIFKDEDDI